MRQFLRNVLPYVTRKFFVAHRVLYGQRQQERYTVTAIACLPVSEGIQSPDAEVVAGGPNQSYVTVRLTPEEVDEYGCRIITVFLGEGGRKRNTATPSA